MDQATKTKEKLSFARVMVEVGLKQELPDQITYGNEHGISVIQKIEYEWRPVLCSNCKGYGHDTEDCRKKEGKKVWVQKSKPDKDGFITITRKAKLVEPPIITSPNPFMALQSEELLREENVENVVRILQVGEMEVVVGNENKGQGGELPSPHG